MFSPADRFRIDLTNVVRRASRDRRHESAINEMVSHFEGLYQEEVQSESGEKRAEASARKRMGNLTKIAFQIVSTPDRAMRGLWLQSAMITLFVISITALIYELSTPTSRANFDYMPTLRNTTVSIFVLSGLLAGVGIYLARKVAWKQFVAASSMAFVFAGLIRDGSMSDIGKTPDEINSFAMRQVRADPSASKIEKLVTTVFRNQYRSSEEFSKELKPLTAIVQTEKSEFYEEDISQGGQYLYPKNLEYMEGNAICYKMTLAHTDDLTAAQSAWSMRQNPYRLNELIGSRIEGLALWKLLDENRSHLWQIGFKDIAKFSAISLGLFVLFSLLSYSLGRLRVVGFDWLRLSRG